MKISDNTKSTITSLDTVLMEMLQEKDNLNQQVIPTGYEQLDTLLGGGFECGKFIIIGGRPAVGKTTLMLNAINQITKNYKISIGVFSLEMGKNQFANRLIEVLSGRYLKTIPINEISYSKKWTQYHEQFSQIYIDDNMKINLKAISERCRLLATKYNVKIIFIDFIQLVNIYMRNTSVMTTELPELLKSLALELQISIVAFSQLSRSAEKDNWNDITPIPEMIPNWEVYENSVDKVILIKRSDNCGKIGSILNNLSIYKIRKSNTRSIHLPHSELELRLCSD